MAEAGIGDRGNIVGTAVLVLALAAIAPGCGGGDDRPRAATSEAEAEAVYELRAVHDKTLERVVAISRACERRARNQKAFDVCMDQRGDPIREDGERALRRGAAGLLQEVGPDCRDALRGLGSKSGGALNLQLDTAVTTCLSEAEV